MNRFQNLTRFALAALFVAALSVAAAAQTATFGGKVLLKQADGTTAPLPGAVVKIYRTDIKQEFSTKSDKNGRFIYAGLPFVGEYTVVVSGPGARPQYFTKIKAAGLPPEVLSNYTVTMEPGDGSTLTLDQVKALEASGGSAPATTAAAPSAEDKKKAAELEAERARIEAENKKAVELNAKLPDILKAGNDAYTAKDYTTAVAKYDEGIAADPTQSVFYKNKAAALMARGTDKFNTGVKARPRDQAAIDAAKEDLKNSTESAEKSVATYRESKTKNAAAAPAAGGSDAELLSYLKLRADAYRVALQTGAQIDNDAAAKAIEEYINAEPDQAQKDKAQASLADALRFAGRYDESIAKFREVLAKNPNNIEAIYGLGIALASKSAAGDDKALVKEAHDTLQQYVSKAPDTNPHKQEAAEMVKYLDDTLKGFDASKEAETKQKTNPRKKP
ncbi:MAG: carboxypeptidase regulatory-like domain-containing protein [Acidobacteriota bacterium]|nr:carboxypeptidase regulatory-like domain-containing protein [Acidobacteriota bacterium]